MSDIKVGDLVVVVKAKSCGCTDTVGIVFRVSSIDSGLTHCGLCGVSHGYTKERVMGYLEAGFPSWRLRRIPPLSELESTETQEETQCVTITLPLQ